LLTVLYIPALANIFNVGPLNPADWGVIATVSLLLVVLMKLFGRFLDNVTRQSG